MQQEKPIPAALLAAADPYPGWAEARRRGAVETTTIRGMQSVHVLRHAEVETVLRDSETFSSEINHRTMGPYMGRIMLGRASSAPPSAGRSGSTWSSIWFPVAGP